MAGKELENDLLGHFITHRKLGIKHLHFDTSEKAVFSPKTHHVTAVTRRSISGGRVLDLGLEPAYWLRTWLAKYWHDDHDIRRLRHSIHDSGIHLLDCHVG